MPKKRGASSEPTKRSTWLSLPWYPSTSAPKAAKTSLLVLSPASRATLEAGPSEPINNLVDGLNMVQKEFMTILNKYGVEKIDALNKKFDHNFHQAVLEVETEESEESENNDSDKEK